jgi:hypothetical protein
VATPGVPERAQRLTLFGPPPLLEGEDAAAYDQLLERIYAAVQPGDILEEIFTNDVVSLAWEILRWRRLKSSLLQTRGLEALKSFLFEQFGLSIVPMNDDAKHAELNKVNKLMQDYARREPDAVAEINELLTDAGVSMHNFMANALAERLDFVERVDRLTANAENRLQASLREIDRRRVLFGETLRRSVQQIEDGQFEEIETAPS